MPPSGHQYHKGQLLPSCSFFWTSCYRNMLLHFDSVQTFTPLKTGAAQQSRDNMESICLILIFLFLFIYLFLLQWTGGRELGRDQMGSVGFMGHACRGEDYCCHTAWTTQSPLITRCWFWYFGKGIAIGGWYTSLTWYHTASTAWTTQSPLKTSLSPELSPF